MTVIDPDKPQAIATIPLGKRPRGIHAGPGFIFVALSGPPDAPPPPAAARRTLHIGLGPGSLVLGGTF